LSKKHRKINCGTLLLGVLAIALNFYLAQSILPGLTFMLGMLFFVFALMNIWEEWRLLSSKLINAALVIEICGLFAYGCLHSERVVSWIYNSGNAWHLMLSLLAAIVVGIYFSALVVNHDNPHRDVNPG
jgi:hypothetical protein